MPDVLGIKGAKFGVLGLQVGISAARRCSARLHSAALTAKFPSEPPALLAAACVCLFATRHRMRRLAVPYSILIPIY